jgi:hypothetical protein
MTGDFKHYIDDPYLAQKIERAPLTDEVEVAIIGGGFGGTWYWNRYPGAACDIESYVYLPLLEEVGYMPERKYSTSAEILWYSQEIARKYRLYDDVCFQTEVTALRWQEDSGRWDYGYTGGSAEGNLTGLADKRVAIIGTGATAVQCVPHGGASARHLYVFQRTPSSIDERNDRPTDHEWVTSLRPGWHQERMDNFNILVSGGVVEEDLVKDGWTEIIRNLLVMIRNDDEKDLSFEAMQEKMELADFQKMNQIRALNEQSKHLAWIVAQCQRGNHKVVEATEQAEAAWVDTIVKLGRLNEKFLADCTPGYYNNEGKPHERSLQNTNYGLGPVAFYKLLEDWRDEGHMEGLRLA